MSEITLEVILGELKKLEIRMDNGFIAVDKRFVSVDKQLASVDKQLALIDKRFDKLETDLASVKADTKATREQVGKLTEAQHAFDSRVSTIEKRLSIA